MSFLILYDLYWIFVPSSQASEGFIFKLIGISVQEVISMPRGGFYAGGDYVPYQPENPAYFTAASVKEFRKQKTVFCENCRNEVPLKAKCVFCDSILE